MHKPRSLYMYAVHVAECKVRSGYLYVCSSTQYTAPRHQHHGAFIFVQSLMCRIISNTSVHFLLSLWIQYFSFKTDCLLTSVRGKNGNPSAPSPHYKTLLGMWLQLKDVIRNSTRKIKAYLLTYPHQPPKFELSLVSSLSFKWYALPLIPGFLLL